jgi:type II secretory pathway component GspD/PulD (secretin)
MHSRSLILALTALFASLAVGQTVNQPGTARVFHLSQSESPQDLNGMVTVVRTIAEVSVITAPDVERGTIPLRGTAGQVTLAEWLLSQLDQPVPSNHQPAAYDYQEAKRDPAVRVFRLANIETPVGLNRITTAVRTIADVSRVLPYNAQRAIVVRGTPGQAALAEWLLNQLDQPASPVHESATYHFEEAGDDPAVLVFRLANVETSQDLQEITNAIRVIADVRKILPYVVQGAVIMRGSADQIAMAEWLVGELDQPAGGNAALCQDAAGHEFQVPDSDQIVHVFHFTDSTTAQQFVDIAAQARRTQKLEQVYICYSQRALSVRGTLDQIALTEQLIQEMMKP